MDSAPDTIRPPTTQTGLGQHDPCDEDPWASRFPSPQTYPPGVELFYQDAMVREVYWLEDGLVKLVRVDGEGRERILGLRSPGRLVGAALVIVGRPSPVSAVTVTRCRLCRMSGHEFAQMISADSNLSWKVHEMQSREVYGQFQRLAELSGASSRERLEHFLRSLLPFTAASNARAEVRVCLPLKRWELAQLIAVTPEHLSRLFRQLSDEGVIQFRRGWIVIPDAHRLRTDLEACQANAAVEPAPPRDALTV